MRRLRLCFFYSGSGEALLPETGAERCEQRYAERQGDSAWNSSRWPKIAFRAEKTTFREKSPPFFAVWYIMYLYKSVYSVLLNSFLQNLQNGEADTFDFDLFLEEHRT